MSEKAKQIHATYCNYEVAKASKPSRIYSVRTETRKPHGIKTHNMSRAMLAQTLASLFSTEGGCTAKDALLAMGICPDSENNLARRTEREAKNK